MSRTTITASIESSDALSVIKEQASALCEADGSLIVIAGALTADQFGAIAQQIPTGVSYVAMHIAETPAPQSPPAPTPVSVTPVANGTAVALTHDDGSVRTVTVPAAAGVTVTDATLDTGTGNLVATLSDGTTHSADPGSLPTA